MAFTPLVQYKGKNDGRGPSPIIWANLPRDIQDPNVGYELFDDFKVFGVKTLPTTVGHASSGYDGFGSASNTIADAGVRGGAITLAPTVTDNLSMALSTVTKPFQITSNASSAGKPLWFEARIKCSTVGNTESNFFVGLAGTSVLAVAVPLAIAGAVADINAVGFHRKEADGNIADFVYKANGVTAVEQIADSATLVADTFIKLGFYFDGETTLTTFVDGVANATTKTIPNATGTDFPSDVTLGPIIAQMNAAGSPGSLTIDWWRVAQLSVDAG